VTQNSVLIFEMSPRDGLLNEPVSVLTATRITLIKLLSKCGFADIEATSFFSQKWVPQLADNAACVS
jgi:hydroxymethylglutaryl-CoA lyase